MNAAPRPRRRRIKAVAARHAGCDVLFTSVLAPLAPPPSVGPHFPPFLVATRVCPRRSSPMIGLVRAAALCATLAFGLVSAHAADKAFKRDDLTDAAIKLEAQIKSEAGPGAQSAAAPRTAARGALKRNDMRSGLQTLGQIVATAPEDSANWLKLARTIFLIRTQTSSEQTFFLERASTAAYIAYQRAANPQDEADALAVLGRALSERHLFRPALDALRLSLDLREVADVRGQYEKLRDEHGFKLLDYTVDSDSASPRACFQFSED